jgi:hypothetical protein
MSESRARRKEIAELKRTGVRQVATPWPDTPVMVPMESAWLITDTEFAAALARAHARPVTAEAMPDTLKELARLALWAERSGVKESICQDWYAHQQQRLFKQARGETESKSFLTVLG